MFEKLESFLICNNSKKSFEASVERKQESNKYCHLPDEKQPELNEIELNLPIDLLEKM